MIYVTVEAERENCLLIYLLAPRCTILFNVPYLVSVIKMFFDMGNNEKAPK